MLQYFIKYAIMKINGGVENGRFKLLVGNILRYDKKML